MCGEHDLIGRQLPGVSASRAPINATVTLAEVPVEQRPELPKR